MKLLKNFFRKDAAIKIIVLFVLLLILYYFLTVGYRADESAHMMFGNLIAGGYRPFFDFWESHGTILRDIVASSFKLGIPSNIFAVSYRIISFGLYMIIIYHLIRQFNKRNDNLLFQTNKNVPIWPIILISSVIGIVVSYSALIPDTLMILSALLGFFFLVKGGIKNHILAGIIFAFSLLCVQKLLFILPLLYILSLEKDFLKNYRKFIINWIISGLSMAIFLALYIIIRYYGYSFDELMIIKESLFGINSLIHTPVNIFNYFFTFKGGGFNNLCYMLPGIVLLFLSKRKAFLIIFSYMIIQFYLMAYFGGLMPKMIIRYFFIFFAIVPIFFNYKRFDKNTIIKSLLIFIVFAINYIALNLSNQWNKLITTDCNKVFEIFSIDYDKKTPIFYDNYCFREAYDNGYLLKKFKSDHSILGTYDYDVNYRLLHNVSFDKINTLHHLRYKFSTGNLAETILRKYNHVYDIRSGCDYNIKTGTYDQMLNDSRYFFPPVSCVPLIKRVMIFFNYNQDILGR